MVALQERECSKKRYINQLIDIHKNLSFHSLFRAEIKEKCLYYRHNREGLTTIAIQTRDLKHYQLLGIMGFRLSQYLQLGWADAEIVYKNCWFHEPLQSTHEDDVHIITGNHLTGKILCYATITGNKSDPNLTLDADNRSLFPCEEAHGTKPYRNLHFLKDVPLAKIKEVKRLVKNKTENSFGQRPPMETIACVLSVAWNFKLTALIGDLEEKGVLRHLRILNLDVEVIEDTYPHLSLNEVMHPAYVKRKHVKPFAINLRGKGGVKGKIEFLQNALDKCDDFSVILRGLLRNLNEGRRMSGTKV